eukprot:scaffold250190_cov27-Tisochrysis_lutea.AAC.4
MTMVPPKYQWRECSELDWAMSKHSTSVGSRCNSLTKSLRRAPLRHERDGATRRGDCVRDERLKRLWVDLLGHAVVQHGGMAGHIGWINRRRRREEVSPRDFDALNLGKAACGADGECVRAPSGAECEPRPDLEEGMAWRGPEEALSRCLVLLERFCDQPAQPRLLVCREGGFGLELDHKAALLAERSELGAGGSERGTQLHLVARLVMRPRL